MSEVVREKRALVILAGTPGTKRSIALARVTQRSGGRKIAVQDVELLLHQVVRERIAAGDEFFARALQPKDPSMQDVTWKLAQDYVCTLWEIAAKRALEALAKEQADIHVLVSHLTYYRGETHEFYSPAARGWEIVRDSPEFRVVRILTLIDDVYDIYVRLGKKGEVFDIRNEIERAYSTLAHDEVEEPKTDADAYRFALGIVVRNLLRLLAWREKEILTAENLAGQMRADALVLAVKHPVEIGVGLLFGDYNDRSKYLLTYLSHPISRPRRTQKRTNNWPPFVTEFHEFIAALIRTGSRGGKRCLPVMPTAIDEFRIAKDEKDRFKPLLATRWPLLTERADALLYHLADGYERYDEYEREMIASIFNPPLNPQGKKIADDGDIWTRLHDEQIKSEVSGLLRALVMTIELQMANRDHLLVRQCPGFLLYRPLYEESRFSDGVNAEIVNRKNIVEGLKQQRPLVFIHTSEDTKPLVFDPQDLSELWEKVRTVVKETTEIDLGGRIPPEVDLESDNWFDALVAPRRSELSSGSVSASDAEKVRQHQAEIVAAIDKIIAVKRTLMMRAGADDNLVCSVMQDDITAFAKLEKPERAAKWSELVTNVLSEWLDR